MSCDVFGLAAPGVRGLQPYQPGKPISEIEREYGVTGIIKLASNENPLGPSPKALSAISPALKDLALYPDGSGFELCRKLADKHSIDPARITLGNGSNDVLVLLAEAFLTPQDEAVCSEYCFAIYPIAVRATGATPRAATANAGDHEQPLGHDLAAMAALVSDRTRLVFIANPNNPTGTWLEADDLQRFIASMPPSTLVVVDEAYHEYAADLGLPDATAWLDTYPNLVVTRTFSKAYGLAGLRVGYALSSPEVADLLNRVRQPFNLNSLALAAAEAAVDDAAFIGASVAMNAEGRTRLTAGLKVLELGVMPSAGNFVLADLGRPAGPVYERLLRGGIITRPVGNYGLTEHLRITVGTASQNEALLSALDRALSAGGGSG